MSGAHDPRTSAGPKAPEGQTIDHPGLTEQLSERPDHGEESYTGSGKLDGRVALITGGDSGIGRAVAIAFAREGADVHVVGLEEEQIDADETARWVRDAGRRALVSTTDIRKESSCHQLVERTVEELGRLDIVVNNAAYQMSLDRFEDLTTEQLLRTFTTNVFAAIWISQAALTHLAPGSSIINTTSIQASSPSPHLVDYAATKAALANLTQNLGQELAPLGIRVNAVAPGPIWTPLIPATMPKDKVDGFGTDTSLGRVGQPADVAPAFVYLASDDAAYVVGATIHVTGGS